MHTLHLVFSTLLVVYSDSDFIEASLRFKSLSENSEVTGEKLR